MISLKVLFLPLDKMVLNKLFNNVQLNIIN